jgi:hypothetical protein
MVTVVVEDLCVYGRMYTLIKEEEQEVGERMIPAFLRRGLYTKMMISLDY